MPVVLHRVSKLVGRGRRRTLVLDDVSWTIPPRRRIAILGQRGAGKSTLLEIISGVQVPTRGWVERRAVVSPVHGLVRYGTGMTTAVHLVERLAVLFRTSDSELMRYVEQFAELEGQMNVPVRQLTRHQRQVLNFALFYGLPCDLYLFDGRFDFGSGALRMRCRQAFLQRQKSAGMILATDRSRIALEFGGSGGVLHRGKIALFETVEEAIEVFEALPPPDLRAPSSPEVLSNDDDDLEI